MAMISTYAASGNLGLAATVVERKKNIDPDLKEVIEAGTPGAPPIGDATVAKLLEKIKSLEEAGKLKDKIIAKHESMNSIIESGMAGLRIANTALINSNAAQVAIIERQESTINSFRTVARAMSSINRLTRHIYTERPIRSTHICQEPQPVRVSLQMLFQMMASNARCLAMRQPGYSCSNTFWDPICRTIMGFPEGMVLDEAPLYYRSRIMIQGALQRLFCTRINNCTGCATPSINCITYEQLIGIVQRYNTWVDTVGGDNIDKIDAAIFARLI